MQDEANVLLYYYLYYTTETEIHARVAYRLTHQVIKRMKKEEEKKMS